jgi:hypothetical protein
MRIRSVRRARERARVSEENGKREKGKVALLTRCPGTHCEGSRKSAGQPRRRRERGGASCTAWSPMFPRDDDDGTNRRRKENAVGARSIEKAFKFGFPFKRLAPQFRRRFKDKLRNQTSSPFAFQVINSSHVQSSSLSESQGTLPPFSTFRPHPPRPSEAHTCAREQQPNPTSPHRHLFHHTHVTRTWAIASLLLRHRPAGAGACTRTPGRRGRQPWR